MTVTGGGAALTSFTLKKKIMVKHTLLLLSYQAPQEKALETRT